MNKHLAILFLSFVWNTPLIGECVEPLKSLKELNCNSQRSSWHPDQAEKITGEFGEGASITSFGSVRWEIGNSIGFKLTEIPPGYEIAILGGSFDELNQFTLAPIPIGEEFDFEIKVGDPRQETVSVPGVEEGGIVFHAREKNSVHPRLLTKANETIELHVKPKKELKDGIQLAIFTFPVVPGGLPLADNESAFDSVVERGLFTRKNFSSRRLIVMKSPDGASRISLGKIKFQKGVRYRFEITDFPEYVHTLGFSCSTEVREAVSKDTTIHLYLQEIDGPTVINKEFPFAEAKSGFVDPDSYSFIVENSGWRMVPNTSVGSQFKAKKVKYVLEITIVDGSPEADSPELQVIIKS